MAHATPDRSCINKEIVIMLSIICTVVTVSVAMSVVILV